MELADFSTVSPWLFVLAPLVIVVAYTVFGLSGFGSTVISVPILAHFLPVSYLVPLMALLDLVSASIMGTAGRKQISRGEMKRIIPFMFVGFVVGATVLVKVPDEYLRIALGVFAMAVGVYGIVNPGMTRAISAWWSIPVGIVGGAVATVFGAGGPVYASYLSGRLDDKTVIRSTMSALISVSAFTRALVYAVTGLMLHMAILAGLAVLWPFVWLGLRLGHRIHVGLTQRQMRRAIGCMLLVTGGSLVVRVFFPALMAAHATPATAFLAKHGVEYTEHEFDYLEHGGTGHSSKMLDVPEHEVVKTLVMENDKGEPLIVLMHGDRKVSTKELARAAGMKRITPCKPEVATRHSGYLIGGTSPFGTRKRMPVFLEKGVLGLARIYINGGRRGYLLGMAPGELVRLLSPVVVEVALRE